MISPFIGEFLFHPAAIEISGNTCSHQCIYCFANIRHSSRYMKLRSVINKLSKISNKTYLDNLIKEEFPICVSNRSDPFSKNNYKQSLSVFHHLIPRQNGIFIQTKGGYGIDEALEILKDKKNIVWYITINHLKDNYKIEPNAASIKDRLNLIEKLKTKGYHVIAALNPIVREWLPWNDMILLTNELRNLNINDIVLEPLHLKTIELQKYSQKRIDLFGDKIIEDAKYKDKLKNNSYVYDVQNYLLENKFAAFKLGQPIKTEIFNNIRKAMGLIFPNIWDVINYCYTQNYKDGYVLTCDKYIEILTKYNPLFFNKKFNNLSNMYILKHSFRDWKGNEIVQKYNTLIDIFKAHWKFHRIRSSMQNNFLFRKIVTKDSDVLDNKGKIKLYFDGNIHRQNRTYMFN